MKSFASPMFATIPATLADPLIDEYRSLSRAYLEGKWKYTSLDAGRFCEIVYTILDGATSGSFAAVLAKPSNFVDACSKLSSRSPIQVGDRSLRILLPRILPPIYEIRNNRDSGHIGGEVTSNKIDATFTFTSCSFILAELVRVFHGCKIEEAQELVDSLVDRIVPVVWDFGASKRVLAQNTPFKDKVLLLLYSEQGWVEARKLFEWCQYSGYSMFKKSVLSKLDRDNLVAWDTVADRVLLSPLGVKRVETDLVGLL